MVVNSLPMIDSACIIHANIIYVVDMREHSNPSQSQSPIIMSCQHNSYRQYSIFNIWTELWIRIQLQLSEKPKKNILILFHSSYLWPSLLPLYHINRTSSSIIHNITRVNQWSEHIFLQTFCKSNFGNQQKTEVTSEI